MVCASQVSTDSPLTAIFTNLVPIFPNRFESSMAKDGGNGCDVSLILEFALTLIFVVLVFRSDDAAAHGAVQMFTALSC